MTFRLTLVGLVAAIIDTDSGSTSSETTQHRIEVGRILSAVILGTLDVFVSLLALCV